MMNVQPRSLIIREWLNVVEVELRKEREVAARVGFEDAIREAKTSERHQVQCRENIYLYFIALPVIFRTVRDVFNLTEEEARKALRGEYFRKFPEYMSQNPFNRRGHPLPKSIRGYDKILHRRKGLENATPIFQSYPDLALGAPAPASVVFDAKYFIGGDPIKDLVEGVQEVVHYRGLPAGSEGGSLYDFGCLLAFDASPKQSLWSTWKEVKNSDFFWQAGNIVPMIIPGDEAP